MNAKSYLVLFLLFISLLYICESTFINTKQTQIEAKKRINERRERYMYEGDIEDFYTIRKKRRIDDDDEGEEIDATLSAYDRCDHGHTPDDISDCKKYQTPDSSCCLFNYGPDTGCVKIGFKYLGTKSLGAMTVTCYSDFIKAVNFLIIMAVLIL